MAGPTDLFGSNDTIKQILAWQVVGQIAGALLAPAATALAEVVWTTATVADIGVPLSPAELALAVLRGNLAQPAAETTARASGVTPEDFQTMIDNTGEPISIEQALFLWRRKLLTEADVNRAVMQSRVRNEWLTAVKDLADVPISPSDAVDAAVENQIPRTQAEEIAGYSGISPESFNILYNTRGRPPGPSELLEMVRRGIIDKTGTGPDALTLEQGIAESAVKTKWTPKYYALLDYVPPPRTVTALERAGVISPDQAQAYYRAAGLTPELAAAYSVDATQSKTAKVRELTEAQLLSMYRDGYLDTATTTSGLAVLGYSQPEITTLLGWQDVQRELKAVNAAITKLQTLYVAHKIGTTTVHAALNTLGMPADQVGKLLAIWTLEREAKVATLTAAQIGTALKHQIIDQPTAMTAMAEIGYSPFDAWLFLSQHVGSALPDQPPPGTSVTGVLA